MNLQSPLVFSPRDNASGFPALASMIPSPLGSAGGGCSVVCVAPDSDGSSALSLCISDRLVDLVREVVHKYCLALSLIFSMLICAPPSASSAIMSNVSCSESIACGVDASHCRVSVTAQMNDMLMKRCTRGKRDKPSTGCCLSQMRVHRASANNVRNKTALVALHERCTSTCRVALSNHISCPRK